MKLFIVCQQVASSITEN